MIIIVSNLAKWLIISRILLLLLCQFVIPLLFNLVQLVNLMIWFLRIMIVAIIVVAIFSQLLKQLLIDSGVDPFLNSHKFSFFA